MKNDRKKAKMKRKARQRQVTDTSFAKIAYAEHHRRLENIFILSLMLAGLTLLTLIIIS